MSNSLISELAQLSTEQSNPKSLELDKLATLELVSLINQEDALVAPAVNAELSSIAQAVDAITLAFEQGGRLIYLGAGTSGRLGILDAVECPPTFSTPDQQVIGLIAGGTKAIFKAVEGAEDNEQLAIDDLTQIQLKPIDIVVGIAASGRTPYVLSAVNYAKTLGCTTIGVTTNQGSRLSQIADIAIAPNVGAEVLTGSTRLKSGTAQKMVLNMLSTASMIKLGKVYKNLMVDVHASNEKLKARAVRIVMQATDCNEQQASEKLAQADNQVKLAILMQLTHLPKTQAQQLLEQQQGKLRDCLEPTDGH